MDANFEFPLGSPSSERYYGEQTERKKGSFIIKNEDAKKLKQSDPNSNSSLKNSASTPPPVKQRYVNSLPFNSKVYRFNSNSMKALLVLAITLRATPLEK